MSMILIGTHHNKYIEKDDLSKQYKLLRKVMKGKNLK